MEEKQKPLATKKQKILVIGSLIAILAIGLGIGLPFAFALITGNEAHEANFYIRQINKITQANNEAEAIKLSEELHKGEAGKVKLTSKQKKSADEFGKYIFANKEKYNFKVVHTTGADKEGKVIITETSKNSKQANNTKSLNSIYKDNARAFKLNTQIKPDTTITLTLFGEEIVKNSTTIANKPMDLEFVDDEWALGQFIKAKINENTFLPTFVFKEGTSIQFQDVKDALDAAISNADIENDLNGGVVNDIKAALKENMVTISGKTKETVTLDFNLKALNKNISLSGLDIKMSQADKDEAKAFLEKINENNIGITAKSDILPSVSGYTQVTVKAAIDQIPGYTTLNRKAKILVDSATITVTPNDTTGVLKVAVIETQSGFAGFNHDYQFQTQSEKDQAAKDEAKAFLDTIKKGDLGITEKSDTLPSDAGHDEASIKTAIKGLPGYDGLSDEAKNIIDGATVTVVPDNDSGKLKVTITEPSSGYNGFDEEYQFQTQDDKDKSDAQDLIDGITRDDILAKLPKGDDTKLSTEISQPGDLDFGNGVTGEIIDWIQEDGSIKWKIKIKKDPGTAVEVEGTIPGYKTQAQADRDDAKAFLEKITKDNIGITAANDKLPNSNSNPVGTIRYQITQIDGYDGTPRLSPGAKAIVDSATITAPADLMTGILKVTITETTSGFGGFTHDYQFLSQPQYDAKKFLDKIHANNIGISASVDMLPSAPGHTDITVKAAIDLIDGYTTLSPEAKAIVDSATIVVTINDDTGILKVTITETTSYYGGFNKNYQFQTKAQKEAKDHMLKVTRDNIGVQEDDTVAPGDVTFKEADIRNAIKLISGYSSLSQDAKDYIEKKLYINITNDMWRGTLVVEFRLYEVNYDWHRYTYQFKGTDGPDKVYAKSIIDAIDDTHMGTPILNDTVTVIIGGKTSTYTYDGYGHWNEGPNMANGLKGLQLKMLLKTNNTDAILPGDQITFSNTGKVLSLVQ